jgi:hypothetical protein
MVKTDNQKAPEATLLKSVVVFVAQTDYLSDYD